MKILDSQNALSTFENNSENINNVFQFYSFFKISNILTKNREKKIISNPNTKVVTSDFGEYFNHLNVLQLKVNLIGGIHT